MPSIACESAAGGMLWYLHNEIIWHHWIRVGSFSSIPKTRLERWRVKVRPTCAPLGVEGHQKAPMRGSGRRACASAS